jgi:hypothetical protein
MRSHLPTPDPDPPEVEPFYSQQLVDQPILAAAPTPPTCVIELNSWGFGPKQMVHLTD